jgi:hypothetical protein
MSDFDTTVQGYLAAWNEPGAEARRTRLAEVCTEEVRYVDPLAAVVGHEALDALIGAVQAQFPGLAFTLAGAVDAHHEQARFVWHLGRAGEEPLVVGFDVVELGADGRIRTVLGFLDKVPAA